MVSHLTDKSCMTHAVECIAKVELQRSSTSWCDVIIDVTDVFYQGFTLTRQSVASKISVWSQGKKFDVVANHLLVQRAKFAPYIVNE